MKVEQRLRGGKKGAPRSRGRGQRKTFQKTDLMVTLPNDESKESRLKPPVSSTQPRKIVRISQNKTESTDLEKVTVKSLEEIKREKELRKESAVLSRLSIFPSLPDPASQIANGYAADSAENDVNGSKLTSSASVPGSSTAKPKLRDFSIPLKPLPAQSSANCKILHAKSQVATVSSLSQVEEHEMETREVRMDFDSKLAEQDFDYVDDEEESDSVEDYDEDFLLKEDEEIEMEGDSSLKQSLNSNFSSYTSDEPEDDEISLHPDDSMFDEEDEPRSSNSRTLGRRSGSQSKDLRSQITDRQKGNSTKMINITVGEPEGNEVKDERQGMSESSEQDESLLKRSENRERDSRNSSHKRLSRERDNRHGPRDSRHFVDRRKGRARFRGSVPMRGKGSHGSRQAPRKGNVPNVFPNTIPPLPSLLGHGGGLLPLPSPANMGLVSQIQRALEANIVNNLKTQVEMLTNPPPVPGEIITNFDQSKKHTSVLRGAQNVPNDFRNSGRHSARRTHNTQPKPSSVSKQSSISTVTQPAQVSSQQNDNKGRDIPKWLQKTYKQGQESQTNAVRGFTSTKDEQNTAVSPRSKNTATAKESFEYGHSSRPIIDSTLTHRSPHSDSNVEMQLSSNKRRSPFHAEEVPHGGKIVVATSPEGIPQPRMQNRSPKQLYPEQFQTGSYLSKPWHLPKQELEEHQKLRQLGHVNSQDHLAVVEPASVQQQIKVDIPDVSYDLVNELLQNGNLGAAWQMIEKLRSMNHPPDLSVLQHVLTLCSKHLQDPDVAAQVAHNAFDMIGGMVVHHNRHNYETLIKTLCHSGQYIRAYEMLEVMKKNSHAPTYDVFLDLVQASVKDPEWAFSLLDEIKQSGVFRSKICSDLILLGCKSGEFFIERTWLLFQEALKNQVQVTAEAISAILFTLAQANEWDKIMSVLLAVSEALPGEILKSAVLMATQKIDWIEAVIAVLAMTPAEKGLVLDKDVWNTFLSNCCADHGNNISFAQRVYSLMQQNEIPLSPMSVNNYMRALSHCGNWMAALELFTAVHKDPQVVQQAQALKSGLIALSSALQKAAASSGMLNVVHFMMVHHIKPEDSVLQSAVEYLDNEKNYKGVQEFFKQLQDNAIVAPLVVYKEIVSSLEKWIEDPEASTEPYTAMRRAYPSGQSYAANKNEASSDSVKNEAPRKVCKYIGTPKGCFSGVNCKFLHPEGSMPVHEGSQQTAPQSVKPVPAATLQTLQQNTNSSAGNVPVINAAAESEMSPFMLQSTSVNPLPFTINLGSVQGTSTEQSHCSMKSQKQSQATQLCKFFNTHQWCRWGDNCRFIHHTSSVAMEADSNTVVPELPPVRSTEARVSKNHTGNPFVLRSLSSTSTFASENRLFGFANNWQPPSSGFQPAAPVTPTVHSAAAKPVTASNHFQLVDGSQLVGKNPFSPNFSGRTQSLDGLREHKATEHNQQAHSAPVVPERPGISHFRFPSKKSIEFYLPRIQFASQQNSWEDLGYVYVSMKKEAVEINNSVIECFYQSFQTFCAADTIGQSFETFTERIERNLKETMAELDKVDKEFIGQIGVALMYFCYRSKHFIQGRQILYLLHKLGIDYYLYSGEFGLQQRPLTATEVVLTAVDICLNLEKPAYDDALVVLQSTNLALSYYERETVLTTEEADWKRRVFLCLCKKFMDDKQLHIVKELLSQVGNIDVFGRDVVNVLYNELVVALINNNEPHVTTEVVKIMGANSILVDPETTRALVRGFGAAGFGAQARQHFSNGCDAGVYPDSFKIDDPWTVVIGTSFSAVESQLYIARHLDFLYLHIEKLACAAGDAVLDDKYYRPLKVVIESDEEQTVVNKFMRGDEIIRCVREMLCTVLANDFNPPLACHPKMRDEEVIVDAMSLKRWFRANPASGRSRRGDRLLSPPRAHTSGSNPYLLPGMTNVVPTDDQRGDRRVFVVSEADSLAPGKTIVPEEVQPATFLSQRGQPLTRKVSGRGHLKITKTT